MIRRSRGADPTLGELLAQLATASRVIAPRAAGVRRPRRVRPARVARRGRPRRLRDGHGRRPPHPPLPRAARRSRAGGPRRADARARRARRRCSSSATRATGSPPTSGPRGDRRPARVTSCSSRSTSTTASRAGAGRSATSSLEREVAMAHGRAAVGVVHRLRRADRPVALELTPLCTWRERPRRALRRTATPRSRRSADGFVFEGAYRVAGAGWQPGGEWYRGVRAREEAARGLNAARTCGRQARSRPSSRRARRYEVTAAAAPFDGALPAARRRSCRRARARAARSCAAPAPATRRRAARARRRPVRDRPPAARPPSPATRGSASGRATR